MFQLNRLIRLPRTNKVNNYHRYINTKFGANTTVHTPCNQIINQNNDELVLIRKELEDTKKELKDTKKIIIYPIVTIYNTFTDMMMCVIGFYIFVGIFWGTISLILYMSEDNDDIYY